MKTRISVSGRQRLVINKVLIFSMLAFFSIIIWVSINKTEKALASGNETISAGSYIINMGITPQTTGNGLKPYGLVYDLIATRNIPVKWVINQSKSKDGTDFTYNSINYRGGSFIIPGEFITPSVAALITTWNIKGVQGAYTTSTISVPVYATLTSFPKIMIDSLASLQSINIAYYDSAGIPSSAYTIGAPANLTNCYDLWTNPHGDPTWNTHKHLYDFVTVQKSFVWAECHSVSMLEACKNSSAPFQQLNFLSTAGLQCWGANKCSGITSSHSKPATAPFTYYYAGDPIMQFMGNMHDATSAGSEQWYIPDVTGQWRLESKRGVTTANGASPKEGAAIIYGPAYGIGSNGWVMYEGGHDLGTSGSSATDRVAAVRAYMNFVLLAGTMRQVNVSLTLSAGIQPGSTGVATATAGSGTPPYTYSWSSLHGGTFSNAESATTLYTAPNFTNDTIDIVRVVVTDACGRKNFTYKFITISSSVLPVTLISFSGKRINKDVELNWHTATEKNNDYFTIERSIDGIKYNEISKIKSNGNSSAVNYYNYIDKNAPADKLYYRLSQTDIDGTRTDFKTIILNSKIKDISLLSISPNPFIEELNIVLESDKESDISIVMYNLDGQIIKEIPYQTATGVNLANISVSEKTPSGIYIIKIMNGGMILSTSRVVKK